MKKICLISMMIMVAGQIFAQQPHHINSFFDKNGAVRLETAELKGDTVITLFHRTEDILWHRTVYSVIDMRFKQNFQLYFPSKLDNPRYRSLLGVIAEAIQDGLTVYTKNNAGTDINPHFEALLIPGNDIISVMEPRDLVDAFKVDPNDEGLPLFGDDEEEDALIEGSGEIVDGENQDNEISAGWGPASLFEANNATGKVIVKADQFDAYAKNQLKFLIQEQIFFDKHYSRLYRCISAIAPLYAPKFEGGEDGDAYEALYQQIVCWIPFAALRPYMAHQYMIASKNNSKRQTFDEFFAQRLYTSYIVGEDNMYDRVIPEYVKTEESMKAEQKRIETELLEFEQNLWEY